MPYIYYIRFVLRSVSVPSRLCIRRLALFHYCKSGIPQPAITKYRSFTVRFIGAIVAVLLRLRVVLVERVAIGLRFSVDCGRRTAFYGRGDTFEYHRRHAAKNKVERNEYHSRYQREHGITAQFHCVCGYIYIESRRQNASCYKIHRAEREIEKHNDRRRADQTAFHLEIRKPRYEMRDYPVRREHNQK